MRILGLDEVGRGCIAGPLVVAAVLLDCRIPGIKDSKLLSRRQRERFCQVILERALYVGLGWVSAGEIDRIGLSRGLALASSRSLKNYSLVSDRTIVDGNYNYLPKKYKCEAVIRADTKIASVSAASIVAKVARDNYMIELSHKLPDYGFEAHVGYCTAQHLKALNTYGCTDYHRKSFEPVKTLLRCRTSVDDLSLDLST